MAGSVGEFLFTFGCGLAAGFCFGYACALGRQERRQEINVHVSTNQDAGKRTVVADMGEPEYEVEMEDGSDDGEGGDDEEDEVRRADWWKKGKSPYGEAW